MREEFKALRLLAEECLDNDPTVRPNIATICRRIAKSKDDFMKESHYAKDVTIIEFYEQFEDMRITAKQLKVENEFLIHEIEQLQIRQLVRII